MPRHLNLRSQVFPTKHEVASQSPVHVDIREILEEQGICSEKLQTFNDQDINTIAVLMEFAWNRGYKKGYDLGLDHGSESQGG